jgi:CheY-like chemotaxis protein
VAKRILIVEDDVGLREVLQEALEFEGYVVATAGNGVEAIEGILATPPDIVVCDMLLPGMGGSDVAAELQRRGLRPGLPLVFLTGTDRSRRSTDELGADELLEKPVDLADLVAAISRLTGGAEGGAPLPS